MGAIDTSFFTWSWDVMQAWKESGGEGQEAEAFKENLRTRVWVCDSLHLTSSLVQAMSDDYAISPLLQYQCILFHTER